MTVSLTEIRENHKMRTNEAIRLQAVGKKYTFLKKTDRMVKDYFEDFWALKDVSLDIRHGETLGIIGRNGAGKTTLLNIIAGVLPSTHGEVTIDGKVLRLFNLGTGFHDELTGRENIFLNGAILGATSSELEGKLSSIIEFSELGNFINMPLGSYSQGMRLRLGFSIIVNLDFDILLIDEVLSVGDTAFQNKCYERLMDFKRSRKTLVITTQSLDFIERLCDKVSLFDHGRLLFHGDPVEGTGKYRALLHKEKFFVGPPQKNINLVENTKKWVDDNSLWGKKLGTKEVTIDSVELINNSGLNSSRINTGDALRLKAHFTVKNTIKQAHFGAAIFRTDGVYCYGPNTENDGYEIPELQPGRGWFELAYKELLLAPGEYLISVAVWDKKETLAFDYHYGYYKLTVIGYANPAGELINIPFSFKTDSYIEKPLFFQKRFNLGLNLVENECKDKNRGVEEEEVKKISVRFLNSIDEPKDTFITNEPLKLITGINFDELKARGRKYILWVGFYRDDNILCQGFSKEVSYKNKDIVLIFPQLKLLPGNYRVSVGVWGNKTKEPVFYQDKIYRFKVIFNKSDHGTVFLEHAWKLKLPYA